MIAATARAFAPSGTLLLTTYRRSGAASTTAMWYVQDDDALYVRTYVGAGKLRRLAGAPEVLVAPCDSRARPSGASIPATARLLEGSEASRAYALLDRAFGVRSYDAAFGSGPGRVVVLAIEPARAASQSQIQNPKS